MAMTVLPEPRRFKSRPRLKRRPGERGAAIFVVVLALMLLTGVGIWSMRSVSMVDQASGYARAAMQGQYLAEMGLITASSLLALPGYARKADAIARGTDPSRPLPDSCRGTAANSYCKVWEVQDIQDWTSDATPGSNGTAQTVFAAFNATDGGSFNAVRGLSLLEGQFVVEMTDGQDATIPGAAMGTKEYKHVVMTSTGVVRPSANVGAVTANENLAAVQLGVRAHLIIGPLNATATP